jgi:hypothetical protein
MEKEKQEIIDERDKNKRIVVAAKSKLLQQKDEIEKLKKDMDTIKQSPSTSEDGKYSYLATIYFN